MQDGQWTRRFVAVAASTDRSNHISAVDALTLGHQRIAEVLISTVPCPDGIGMTSLFVGLAVKDDGMGKFVLDLDDQSTASEACYSRYRPVIHRNDAVAFNALDVYSGVKVEAGHAGFLLLLVR